MYTATCCGKCRVATGQNLVFGGQPHKELLMLIVLAMSTMIHAKVFTEVLFVCKLMTTFGFIIVLPAKTHKDDYLHKID